jgi:hypothetical protein
MAPSIIQWLAYSPDETKRNPGGGRRAEVFVGRTNIKPLTTLRMSNIHPAKRNTNQSCYAAKSMTGTH